MRRFFSKLANSLRGTNTTRDTRRSERRVPLRVEALEERQLLTVSGLALLTPIQAEYAATAGETDAYGNNVHQLLGAATSGEVAVPGVAGARMETFQHGTIYYSFNTGAPPSSTATSPSGTGPLAGRPPSACRSATRPLLAVPGLCVTNFQGGRSIYWTAATGSHAVYAGNGAEYTATAREKDAYGKVVQKVLGAPTSDETRRAGRGAPA